MIGGAVQKKFRDADHDVRLLVRESAAARSRDWAWNPETGVLPVGAIEWADAVVSLNGASLNKLPWTDQYRRKIRQSRVTATSLIATAIVNSAKPPKVWVSASAVGIYGDRPGEVLTEDSARGKGFLADVVADWEAATGRAERATRVVLARTGVVLGPGGGALRPLTLVSRLGLGGRIGPGCQHWPWISLDDEASAIVHLVGNSTLSGPVNLVAPSPATSSDVTRAISSQLRRPHLVPAPAWAMRLAMGEAANDLLLADQEVIPKRLLDEGFFQFHHPDLAKALAAR